MSKSNLRKIVVPALILVLYLLVMFIVPFNKGGVFWLSLVFTLIGFGVAGYTVFGFSSKPDAKSKFYHFPILRIGIIYGGVQLAVGIIFAAAGEYIPTWAALLIYAAGLVAAVIGVSGAESVAEGINMQDEKLKKDVNLMRALQSKVNMMAAQCDDEEVCKCLIKFSDQMKYSDPVSSDSIKDIERELTFAVDELEKAVVEGDSVAIKLLCTRASEVLIERNRLCMLNKY